MANRNFRLVFSFAAIAIIWGFNFIFIDTGLSYSPPIWLACLRALVGFLGALVLLVARKTKGEISLRQRLISFGIGIIGTGVFFGFWTHGEVTVPAGEASVLVYTFPIWTLFLSIPILKDRPSPLKVGASFLGFAGVALVAGTGITNWTTDIGASVMLVIGGFSFALDTVLFKRLFKGEQLLRANVWQLSGATAFLFIWAILSEPVQRINWSWQLAISIGWIGLLGTAVVYVLWFTLISRNNAASFSAYAFVVVLVALVASFILFGERVSALQMVGVVALVSSIYLVNRASSKHHESKNTKKSFERDDAATTIASR